MNRQFSDQVAVITGASRGIGLLLTRGFAQSGASVVFAARRGEPLKRLESELTQAGHRVAAVVADVGRQEDCERCRPRT